MRSISMQFKDSVLLPLFVIAFFLLTATISAYAAEPDTSKSDDSKVHGFVQGTGEVAAGTIKEGDQVFTGMAVGLDKSLKGIGNASKDSLYGFLDGTGKVIAGATGQKASKSTET